MRIVGNLLIVDSSLHAARASPVNFQRRGAVDPADRDCSFVDVPFVVAERRAAGFRITMLGRGKMLI